MAEARIFDVLKKEHDRQRTLLEQIAETTGDSEERRTLFETLRKELQAHAAAEEESLYATMLADPDLRDEARHSVSEHKEVDDMLGELVEADMATGGWLTRFKSLRERYLHHIDEEEEEMFPSAAEAFDNKTEAALGSLFRRRKPDELDRAEAEMPGDARE